jgi:hypothetical protein
MVNLGVLPLSYTPRFMFSTAAADGGEENFSATLEEADVKVHKNGSVMTLSASTITITAVETGEYEIAINQSNDADFTAGALYWVYVAPSDETIDSQAITGTLGCWFTESASQRAQREYMEKVYPGHIVSTTTNNSTTSINLTEIVDAQSTKLVGEVLAVCDVTDDRVILVRVTAFTYPQATVEGLDGAAMAFTVAAGDMIWRVGQYTADVARVKNTTAVSTSSGLLDVNVTHINETEVAGAGTSGDKWRAA